MLFIATAIGALAALSSSRVVTETRQQKVLEDESHALTDAYAQLQLAMNVVNTSAYTDENELRSHIEGLLDCRVLRLKVRRINLVNDTTVRVVRGEPLEYFQLLFDRHHIIYAEGIAAESDAEGYGSLRVPARAGAEPWAEVTARISAEWGGAEAGSRRCR